MSARWRGRFLRSAPSLRIDADQLRYPFYGSDANSTAKASVEEYVGAYRRRNIAQAAPAAERPRTGCIARCAALEPAQRYAASNRGDAVKHFGDGPGPLDTAIGIIENQLGSGIRLVYRRLTVMTRDLHSGSVRNRDSERGDFMRTQEMAFSSRRCSMSPLSMKDHRARSL